MKSLGHQDWLSSAALLGAGEGRVDPLTGGDRGAGPGWSPSGLGSRSPGFLLGLGPVKH